MRKDFKQYLITGVIAFVVASVAAGGAAIAAGRARVPLIKTATAAAPVDIPGTDAVIADLPLPAGKWSVTARFDLTRGASGLYVFCDLVLGDESTAGAEEIKSDEIYDDMTLMVSNTTEVPTAAQLVCNDVSGPSDIDASNIVITAIKAGKLTSTSA